MSWRDVLNLLEHAGGNEDLIDSDKLEAATSKGAGPPDIQMRIARRMYYHKYHKETDYGQQRWEFG